MEFKIRLKGICLINLKERYLEDKSQISQIGIQNKNLHSLPRNPILALSTHTKIQHARIT